MQALAQPETRVKRPALFAELRDGLARRQPELPIRYLLTAGDEMLREKVRALPEPRLGEVERALFASMAERISVTRPRTVVHLFPRLVGSTREALAPLLSHTEATGYIALEDPSIAVPVVPLPGHLERPRLIVCHGNALGCFSTISAVRLLRAVRATMGVSDSFVLGLDLRLDPDELERAHNDEHGTLAAYHLAALAAVNDTLGTDFDLARFRYRARYVRDTRRVEKYLVAQRAHDVTIDGTLHPFRKGESILVGLSASFSRGSLAAMLLGVGLRVIAWRTDERQRVAVVETGIATGEPS